MSSIAVIVIQARTASSRLPGKVLLPLDGKPVLKQIIDRSKRSNFADDITVATTFHNRDDLVEKYAVDAGVQVYRGSEDDVLGRIYRAAEKTGADVVVRLTADNPFVLPELIDAVIKPVRDGKAEYASNKINRTFPLGVDAEAVSIQVLKRTEKTVNREYYREHALRYVRDNHKDFETINISKEDVTNNPSCVKFGPELRLTLDETKDYILYKKIFRELGSEKTLSLKKVTEYIGREGLHHVNSSVEQKTY